MILTGTADVDAVVATRPAIAGIAVSTQNAANDVSKVRHIVDIGQCTGDQDVSLPCAQL